MPRNDDPVEENMVFVRGTGLAVCVEDTNGKEHWMPRSQVQLDPADPDEHDPVTVTMPEWLAMREGLA